MISLNMDGRQAPSRTSLCDSAATGSRDIHRISIISRVRERPRAHGRGAAAKLYVLRSRWWSKAWRHMQQCYDVARAMVYCRA